VTLVRFPIFLVVPLALFQAATAQTQGGPGRRGMGMGMGMAPITGAPLVDVKGKVGQVRIAFGQRMPSVVVKTGSEEAVLYLGSMRYLMEQNFNPKVGDEIVAKAYKTANGLFAAQVTLPAANKTIRLRDETGRPVWRGGPRW
jgi:hypothetical protein